MNTLDCVAFFSLYDIRTFYSLSSPCLFSKYCFHLSAFLFKRNFENFSLNSFVFIFFLSYSQLIYLLCSDLLFPLSSQSFWLWISTALIRLLLSFDAILSISLIFFCVQHVHDSFASTGCHSLHLFNFHFYLCVNWFVSTSITRAWSFYSSSSPRHLNS